jgi:hypothetical protein
MKKAITFDGPEIAALSEKAREYGLYVAGGGVVEKVPEFPDRWFNTAFIIGPDGSSALRYHKWHIPASIGLGSSPHDLLEECTKVFGSDIRSLFPVIDTEIGKLGTMTLSRAAAHPKFPAPSVTTAVKSFVIRSRYRKSRRFAAVGFLDVHAPSRAHDNMCYLLG